MFVILLVWPKDGAASDGHRGAVFYAENNYVTNQPLIPVKRLNRQ